MYIIGLILSIIIGIVLGLVGGGGSILTVPLVNIFFGTSMLLATTYSLFIVTVASAVGVAGNIKSGNIDFKKGIVFVIPSMLVSFFIRVSIVPNFPDNLMLGNLILSLDTLISIILILVILFVAIKSLLSKKTSTEEKITPGILVVFFGLFTGALSGFIGAGGGFIIVPILLRMGLKMKKAVGTSMLIISIQSFVALIGDSTNQQILDGINWPLLLSLTAVTIGGVLIGTNLQKRFTGAFLRLAFNILLILVAIGLTAKFFMI